MSGGPAVKPSMDVPYQYESRTMKSFTTAKTLIAVPALVILDVLAIGFSLLTAYILRINFLPIILPGLFKPELLNDTIVNLWWLPLVLIVCMAYEDLYQKRLPYWKEVEKILKSSTLAVTLAISFLYMAKLSAEISRTLVIMSWLISILYIPLLRYLGKKLLVRLGVWSKPVLIVGAGKTGELVLKALTREYTMGYQSIGFLDDNKELINIHESKSGLRIPILGNFEDAEELIAKTKVQDVIVAAPGLPPKELVTLTNRLQPLVNNVMVVPDLFGLSMNGIEVEYFFDEQTLLLNIKNKLRSALNRGIKRAFDIVTGTIISVLCIPILVILAVLIKVDSRGPAFFKQERLGQNGETFICYKFRTMYLAGDKILKSYLKANKDAREEWQTYNKLKGNDPRVTRVGCFLRKYSLDELPQLINVILGDMSLVGPRPYLIREKNQMGDWIHDILVAKPGITGLWQVSGRNLIEFEGRLKLDTWYVRNWSIWLDIVLLLKTIRVVIKREGAY
ncbi:Undecaprenyl-phosphate galactose phosphotransferase [Desulforamulus reducens MI-1]|uniref:Undecaprenyl-phosphate galactose phosphotransferase n=1 Tax=Desulforamulus reducens (strain ATCC BAA-1160 / DSM 100696 / MI-1) TaxID=349161 RepID=A4J986_DESRM|nr:undecaprenyl-phosphate galactose phosphotransferase WbaP [Desulforamulus reducens]ABO51639.1 Undecaprenyl-phosphate galactose phosphotransferase [Desulforamulus reducens MI-1]